MASLTFAGEAVLAQPSSDPIPVIIETDLGNDIDDALALDLAYQAVRSIWRIRPFATAR